MLESRSIPLATRTGREIPNVQDLDIPPHKAQLLNQSFKKKCPYAHQRRGPTGQYNCHGLTFANRRTQVGISDPQIVKTILQDDGYKPIAPSEVEPGDILVCYDRSEATHSGVVMHVDRGDPTQGIFDRVFVLSKWGHAGEYYHLVNEGPYREDEVTFWSD